MKLLCLLLILLLVGCGGAESGGAASSFVIQPSSASGLEYHLNEGDITNKIIGLSFISGVTGELTYTSFNIDAVAKSDYLPTSGTLQVSAGNEYVIDVEIYADERIEGDEKLGLRLTSIAEDYSTEFTISVLNDDFPEYTVTAVDTTEGSIGTQLATITIDLKESTVDPYNLTLKTLQKEAVGYGLAGSDYVVLEQELVFLEGELSKEISLEIFGDLDIEPDELIEFVISHNGVDSSPYSLAIRSDDFPGQGAPTFVVNSNLSLAVAENETNQVFQMPFSIDETGGFSEPFSLFYYLREISASDAGSTDISELDKDFLINKTAVNISPNQNDYIAEFTVIDDSNLENVEVFELVLANEAGVEFGSGRVYISDNESPAFKVYRQYSDSAGNTITSENLEYLESSNGIGEHKIVVELLGEAGYDFEFEYILRLANAGEVDSAIDAADWEQTISGSIVQSNRLTIEKGSSLPSGTEASGIGFTINSDTVVEGNESFFIELKNINGSSIGEAVEVQILNDDLPEIKWVNDSIALPATIADPFKLNEGDGLDLKYKLIGAVGLGDAALETFDININRQDSSLAVCAWRSTSDLTAGELLISNEADQAFLKSASSVLVNVQSVEDSLVECDEGLTLEVVLSSRNPGVTQTRQDSIDITVVNDDIAQLDVYGFSNSEVISNSNFIISLNTDAEIDIEFLLDFSGAEIDDASHVFNSAPIVVGSGIKTAYQFDESFNQRTVSITSHINNDDIVELDESYQLSVYIKPSLSTIPVELRQCVVGNTPECAVITNQALPAIVLGTINSEDKATLSLTAKSGESVTESSLTALALLDSTVAYPYQITLDKTIASDVPAITVSLSDRCLLVSANDCASVDDYSLLTTDIHDGINETLAGTFDLQFKLLVDDDVVEPSEIAKLSVTLDNELGLSNYIQSWSDQTVDFSFIDNDKLTFSIVDTGTATPISTSYLEGADATNLILGYGISWDKDIAANVPAINISIEEDCDEDVDDLCVVTAVSSNVIMGDVSSSSSIKIHDGVVDTSLNLTGINFGISITGDDLIEPNENTQLLIGLADKASMNPYLISPGWVDQAINFTITNDDELTISLSQAASSVTEGGSGDSNSAGILLSWDKNIAENFDDVTLTLLEQCNNVSNSHCVSDVANLDIQIPSATVNLHEKNTATSATTNQDVGILITGDDVVEPNEAVEVLLALQNELALNNYLTTPWVNQTINLTIDNDDVIIPVLSFMDDLDIAEGEEDTDKDLSAGNNVGLKLTWGNAVIADNTDDLILEVTDSCSNCGVVNTDYSIDRGEVNLVSLAMNGSMSLGFTLTADAMVEPNEIVTINLLKKSSTPSHYFSTVPAGNKFSELSYTINNDERLRIAIVRTDGLTISSLPENQATPLSFSWLGHAASNLPDLSIDHSEDCDNDASDNTLQKCLAENTSLNNSPADISLSASTIIKTTGSEQDATVAAITGILAFNQNDDTWVEINEALKIDFSVPTSLQDYLRFDIVGSSDASPIFSSEENYTLVNDDVLQVGFGGASLSGSISDESAEESATYTLTFDKSVEQDVEELSLNYIDGDTPGQRYAIRSHNLATTTDYRVFYNGTTAEDVIGNDLIIKEVGQALNAASGSLVITVGDDDLVEADELVAFSLKENSAFLALYDTGIELVQNNESAERSFTISLEDQLTPEIRFAEDLVTVEVDSQTEMDSDQAVNAIIIGLAGIDTNIGTLILNSSISCKAAVPMTCSASEAVITASHNLDPATITAASVIDLGFSIKGDQIIEPDEVVTISLSIASDAEYFDFSSNAIRDFTIINDDYLSLSLTDDSTPIVEGDLLGTANTINVIIADEGAGIEGLTSIDYAIVQNDIAGQDNAEKTGDVKDFDFSSSPGSRSIDLATMQAPLSSSVVQAVATINLDHHVEADEIFDLTASLILPSHYLAPPAATNLNAQYTISDDDYLTVVMQGLTAQEENNENFEILICDKEGGKVESDFVLDLSSTDPIINAAINEYMPNTRKADSASDFTLTASQISVSTSDISNSYTYLTHNCSLKNLPISFTDDAAIENNEWLGLNVSSTTSYLCNDASNNCLQQNLVIVNDEVQTVLDTGVTSCITSTGAIESMNMGECPSLSIQDVEIDYPDNQYTYIDSAGVPQLSQQPLAEEIPPASYDCIEDNYSGLLWSSARLPFDGTHSTDGKSWGGAIITNSSTFESLFSANGFCGYAVGSKKWQLPSVEQLLGTVDYDSLENDGVFLPGDFSNELLSMESVYWTKDSCDTDGSNSSLEYWSINMKNGTVSCSAEANQHLIRAVYY